LSGKKQFKIRILKKSQKSKLPILVELYIFCDTFQLEYIPSDAKKDCFFILYFFFFRPGLPGTVKKSKKTGDR